MLNNNATTKTASIIYSIISCRIKSLFWHSFQTLVGQMAQLTVPRTKETTERTTNFARVLLFCFKNISCIDFTEKFSFLNWNLYFIIFKWRIIFIKKHLLHVKSMFSPANNRDNGRRCRAADGQFRRTIVSQLIINNYLVFSVLSCTVFNYPVIDGHFTPGKL